MSTVLMKVLVSQCQDTERALDMLCWPSCSWPDLDRVEALSLFLGELVLKSHSSGFNGFKTKEGFKSKVQSVIWDQCVPLLKMISSENSTQSGKRKEMIHATCAVLMVCVKECQTETLDKIASLVFPALSESKETQADTQQLDTDVAIEVLAVLLSGASSSSDLTKTSLSCTLRSVKELSETWVSKIIVRVWFTCLNSASKEMQAEILCYIWGDLLEWFEQEGTELATERLLLCLTALSDFLFSLEQKGPEMSHTFFKVVQAGLVHSDNVARKRALYLLNRSLSLAESRHADVHICETEDFFFNWTAEHKLVLREFWEAYTLVLETLEEYQIHVIRPVLSRIDMLVKPTSADTQGGGLIHPSWLLCVYQRMFHSENKAVIKEGVTHLLGLQTLQHPSFAIAFSQFIVGPFMDVLAETSLYHRSAEQAIGECPELGLKLQRFLAMFFSSLPEDRQGSVLLQMLKHLSSQRWYSIPLLFLSQALSCLSPRPLLKADGLQILREVLGCSIIHHHILLRGATQCFLLHTVLHLTDVSGVSLNEIFALLAHFRAEESLCPGTPIWEKLCDWFLANEGHFLPASTSTSDSPKKVSVHSYQSLKAFLTTSSSADQANQLPVVGEAEVLARTLLLSADLDWKRKEKQSSEDMTLEQLFCPLLDILHRLNTSVYLPLCKTDKSLQLMLRLLVLIDKNRENGGKMAGALTQLLLDVTEPVQEYILRRLNGDLQEFSDIGRTHLYLSLLRVLIRTYNKVPGYRCNLQKNYVSRLTTNCLRFLSEPSDENPSISGQVQKAVSMATLALLCELAEQCVFDSQSEAMRSLCSLTAYFCPSSSSSSMPLFFNQTLLKPSSTVDISGCTYGDPLLRDWNRVVAYFLRDQWTCISFLQKFAEIPRATEAFQAAVEALSLLPSDLVLPVLDFMCAALPQVLHKEALCLQAVSVSWKLVHALSTNAHDFWPALRAFVRLAFHHSLLELQGDQNHKITACIQKVTCELIELSQAKFGVFNVLIEHCCNTWLPSDPNNQTDTAFESALNHLDILIEACIHGPLYRKDQRLLQEVQTYVKQLGDELAANVVINSWSRDDQFPRLCILAFLSRLEPSNSLHQKLMEQLVQWLIKKDKEISRSKVRYYNNSMQHRVKNRVWQTLLLLLPKLKPEFVVENVFGLVCEAGFGNNQPSVKYLIEWALILILHQNPSQIQHLWACFDVDQEKTKTSICTFLSVLVHLGILLPKLQDKERQWQKALEVILLWCFSHNFTVRLYAFLALKRVWGLEGARHLAANEQCSSASLKGLATVVEACLHQAEVLQSTGNAVKNWSRIQEHFFFSAFHPINDYSVETIFQTFPVLSELAEDECIPMWKFEKLVDFQHSSFVPLNNAGRELSELKPSDWVQQDRGELEQEERWADVQKKIAPWSMNVQEVEPHLVTQQRVARLGKPTTALLVVGSLIDKPTNLGGLCRTCEIFGASALVLGSLHHVGDKQFQALSVSSELWLPLMEVKPMELAGFLQLKQREGYSIIGVEQTANSQSLQSYRFPEKTLLLLGNEREGIPADLLQLLDVCVEIPQQGVTRSLNVHVSAALLVWEYTRQYLNTDQSL